MKTSKELADELDAEDRLIARGYTKIPCPNCGGKPFDERNWNQPMDCPTCGNRGWFWKAPVTK